MLAHFAVVWHRERWYDSIIENCVKYQAIHGRNPVGGFLYARRRWS